MVVVEGVARSFNPKLNMWVTAEPVVAEWVEQNLGARARLEEAADGAATLGKLAAAFPEAMSEVSQATHLLSSMARSGGIRLDKETTEQIAQAQSKHSAFHPRRAVGGRGGAGGSRPCPRRCKVGPMSKPHQAHPADHRRRHRRLQGRSS
jgi:predicted unusual protein kinase regulating ubiquinone biosynthesis (AarF/ABC1/UbiB family)